jgi:hypothetical protein
LSAGLSVQIMNVNYSAELALNLGSSVSVYKVYEDLIILLITTQYIMCMFYPWFARVYYSHRTISVFGG